MKARKNILNRAIDVLKRNQQYFNENLQGKY